MNAEKAREYFSLYFEGSLEKGLLENFERTLNGDAQVQAEYKAFVTTMAQLEALKQPIPEPTFDLHEAISQSLDRHYYELDRKPKSALFGWRKLAFGGLAGIAIVAATMSIMNGPMGGRSGAGFGPGVNTQKPDVNRTKPALVELSAVDLAPGQNGWTFEYLASGKETVSIQTENGEILKTAELTATQSKLSSPISNEAANVSVFVVKFDSATRPISVAMPPVDAASGTEPQSGRGSLADLARAAAAYYGKPVVLAAKNDTQPIQWTFEPNSAASALMTSLADIGYSAEERKGGAIWILPQ